MKKILALLICAMIIIAVSGCAKEEVPEVAPEELTTGEMDFTGKTITIGVWGGTFAENIEKAYVVPFEKATGGEVILQEYGSDVMSLVKAQVEQDIPGFDIISGNGFDMVHVMASAGALQPIDWSKIENADDLMDQGKQEYAMGQYVVTQNFTWNTEYFPNGGPDDAAKFYDVENYPGPRSLINYSATGVLEQALIADGVAVEDLYPLDVERAFAMLDKIKPYVTKWYGSGSEIFQALSDEEAVAGVMWIAHVRRAQNTGVPVEVSFKDQNLIADCWSIPTNAQNLDMVYAFLNFTIDGERAATYTRLMGYGPLVKSAWDYFTEAEKVKLATYPENEAQGFWPDVEYWTENFEELTERYIQWIGE